MTNLLNYPIVPMIVFWPFQYFTCNKFKLWTHDFLLQTTTSAKFHMILLSKYPDLKNYLFHAIINCQEFDMDRYAGLMLIVI